MLLKSPPLLGFCAYSGTGKTTLLTQLIPVLKEHVLKIGLVKHAHHGFDTDLPGKDSYKLRKAGACEMLVASAKRWALVHEFTERTGDPVLEELLPYIEADGGSLQYVETEDGYVKVRLGGACETCAMSVMTLKQGIEKKLMMEIPEVKGVIQVL